MVLVPQRPAVSAPDLLLTSQSRQVPPGCGRGDLESGADFVQRYVGSLLEPGSKLIASCGDNMEGNLQREGKWHGYDWSQSYKFAGFLFGFPSRSRGFYPRVGRIRERRDRSYAHPLLERANLPVPKYQY